LLGDQICEQKPTLTAGKAPLVDYQTIGLGGDPTREEDLQLDLLTFLLPAFCPDLGGLS
jgi:hypothetical protein